MTRKTAVLTLIFLIIAAIFIIRMGETPTSSPTTSAIVQNSSWDGSVKQVKQWLRSNLKDPDSLEIIEWSKVEQTKHGFGVRVKYRAKNSFGGYVVENQLFILDVNGNVLGATPYEAVR